MHIGIEDLGAGGATVVVHEDDERVLCDPPFLEFYDQLPEVLVDVMNHAEETFCIRGKSFAFIQSLVLRPGYVRAVRRVGGYVGVEWTPGFALLVDPIGGLRKEDVGAVALGLFKSAVMQDGRVEVLVPRRVAAGPWIDLPDSPAAMNEDLAESAFSWLIV